jgi:hypothetical protein
MILKKRTLTIVPPIKVKSIVYLFLKKFDINDQDHLAEWSNAVALGAILVRGVGSNPTVIIKFLTPKGYTFGYTFG